MKLMYFSWVREKIGISQEEQDLPEGVADVADLVEWLKSRGDGYADAFADKMIVRVSVNQNYVTFEHRITTDDEVAFFPPVTGG